MFLKNLVHLSCSIISIFKVFKHFSSENYYISTFVKRVKMLSEEHKSIFHDHYINMLISLRCMYVKLWTLVGVS